MNNNNKKPPIAARVEAIAGRQLPRGWEHNAARYGGTFDRRPLEELWKEPNWASSPNVDSPAKNARLPQPSWQDLFGRQ